MDLVRWVRLDHGKVNAIDLQFCQQLSSQLGELVSDPNCRAVVLTGNDRVFSAGIDLKRWLAETEHRNADGEDYAELLIVALESLFEQLFTFPKPLVAAINGAAIAGGCLMTAACDFRLISSGAKIGILESRLGVPLPITAIEILRHVTGANAFRQIVTRGATWIGEAAIKPGLADHSCELSLLELQAEEIARELAQMPPETFALTKQQMRQPVLQNIHRSKVSLFDDYIRIWKSPETRQAIAEYFEKRV